MPVIHNALPYEYEFDLKSTALVIIDMQRDFCCRAVSAKHWETT